MLRLFVFLLLASTVFAQTNWQEEGSWTNIYSELRDRSFFSSQGNEILFGPVAQTYFGMNKGTGSEPDSTIPYYRYINLDSISATTGLSDMIYRFVTGYDSLDIEQADNDAFPLSNVPVPWLVSEAQLITRFIRGETSAFEIDSSAGDLYAFWLDPDSFASNAYQVLSGYNGYRAYTSDPFTVANTNRAGEQGDIVAYTNILDIVQSLDDMHVAGYEQVDAYNAIEHKYNYASPAFYKWNQTIYNASYDNTYSIGTYTSVTKMVVSGTGYTIDGDYDFFDYQKTDGSATIGAASGFGDVFSPDRREAIWDSNSVWNVNVGGIASDTYGWEDVDYSDSGSPDFVAYAFLTLDGSELIVEDTGLVYFGGYDSPVLFVEYEGGGDVGSGREWFWDVDDKSAESFFALGSIYQASSNGFELTYGTNLWSLTNSTTIDGTYVASPTNSNPTNIIVTAIYHQRASGEILNGITYSNISDIVSNTNIITIEIDDTAIYSNTSDPYPLYPSGTLTEIIDENAGWTNDPPDTSYDARDNDADGEIEYIVPLYIRSFSLYSHAALQAGSYITTTDYVLTKAFRESSMSIARNTIVDAYGVDGTLVNEIGVSINLSEAIEAPVSFSLAGPYNHNGRSLASGSIHTLHNTSSSTNEIFSTSRESEFLSGIEFSQVVEGVTNTTYSSFYNDYVFPELEYERLCDVDTNNIVTGAVFSVTFLDVANPEDIGLLNPPEDGESAEELLNMIYEFDY